MSSTRCLVLWNSIGIWNNSFTITYLPFLCKSPCPHGVDGRSLKFSNDEQHIIWRILTVDDEIPLLILFLEKRFSHYLQAKRFLVVYLTPRVKISLENHDFVDFHWTLLLGIVIFEWSWNKGVSDLGQTRQSYLHDLFMLLCK